MSYAVVWQEEEGTVYAGKLELADHQLLLDGLSRLGRPRHRALSLEHIREIRTARRGERIDGRPTLVVERPSEPPLRIGSVGGSGLLSELMDRLAIDAFAD